jgi:alkanesulfonate monooxygenase SsuD/methylene tetrahydromethanopterin reductase-like flavin-dependent oxidoreductase (luciferase family)
VGARDKNFYNDAAKRLGYGAAAIRIQDAFLVGHKAEAVAAVPDALVDEIALLGSADRIRDRLQAWKDAGKQRHVDSMLLSGNVNIEALRVIAEAVL